MARQPHILWVEDSEDDVFFFARAMYKSSRPLGCNHVWNGAQAIEYLSGYGEYCDRSEYPFPDIIITDLRMPGTDGWAFIRWLRSHPEFRRIPIFVLSSISGDAAVTPEAGHLQFFLKSPGELMWDSLYAELIAFCRAAV